ncbi:hypothetical protein C8R44DRAFT_737411 [Mycena epipterygia]|nr:hypothetical protein C8R44DRAFT_737411 [Mycena epipterygia]
MSSLKNLTAMVKLSDTAALFTSLICGGSGSILPNLERLKIGLVNSEESEYLVLLIKMVRSRRQRGPTGLLIAVSQLESLHLVSYEDTPAIDGWWQWKLEKVFPTLELTFDVCPTVRILFGARKTPLVSRIASVNKDV